MRVSFHDCAFDSDTREVFRAGRLLSLSPKAFELLELLIRERPKAVSKEKIHARLWPKTFVSDASLSNLVAELRAALGDDARHPQILRTVQRFGYAFVAEHSTSKVESASASPSFRLLWETREIELDDGENLLGRERGVKVWIDDPSVSRHHARIRVAGRRAVLEDLGSKNGTLRNGAAIEGPVELADGDRLQIGLAALTLRVLDRSGSTQTASSLARPALHPRGKK
ncbi:MAG TPA: FHA domain-containing protein [Thermoanaerobaculia bacterium]